MPPTIAGRCGVVTDATSTIGRAVALELARDGVVLAIGYRADDFEAVERLVREVIAVGGEAIPVRIPVDSLWDLEQLIGDLTDHWGRLDFVVDLDDRCVVGRAVLPWMLERASGQIVHISSAGTTPICHARQDIAQLAARGVGFNSIHLGAKHRAERAAGRACPEDVAASTYFLLVQDVCTTGIVIELGENRPGAPVRRVPSTLAQNTCSLRLARARRSAAGA